MNVVDGSPHRRFPPSVELALQILLIAGAVLVYFGVRGLTERDAERAVENGFSVLELERTLGVDVEQAAQDLVLDNQALTTVSNWVYIWGHWPLIIATLVFLYRRQRRSYLVVRNAMFISGAIGLVVFAIYPVAPPRLLPDDFVDTVTEWSRSYRVLQPPALVNKYAAMPSFHVGWNVLIGVALFRAVRSRLVRFVAVGCPALMAVAVVTTANHYVLDAVVGVAVALFGLVVSILVFRRIDRRRQPETVEHTRVIDDQPVHAPRYERRRLGRVGDRPGEDKPVARLELGDQLGIEQATVDDDTLAG